MIRTKEGGAELKAMAMDSSMLSPYVQDTNEATGADAEAVLAADRVSSPVNCHGTSAAMATAAASNAAIAARNGVAAAWREDARGLFILLRWPFHASCAGQPGQISTFHYARTPQMRQQKHYCFGIFYTTG